MFLGDNNVIWQLDKYHDNANLKRVCTKSDFPWERNIVSVELNFSMAFSVQH